MWGGERRSLSTLFFPGLLASLIGKQCLGLGNAESRWPFAPLRSLGQYEDALAAFCDALKERTQERMPHQWASTAGGLIGTLARLAKQTTGGTLTETTFARIEAAIKTLQSGPLGADIAIDLFEASIRDRLKAL